MLAQEVTGELGRRREEKKKGKKEERGMKKYLRVSDSSRLTGPSKRSPPAPHSERCDHKGDFLGLFMKTEFSGVSSRAPRPYHSSFLNTWHLLFFSQSGSQV
ncbi:hypothetical protein FQN60_017494 [Etheostoma spectabile]|uniref:Uncharacterized protein n=1 Tax=Etheostoma spectabile TaxID=54343 RepID=A0A5J5CA82_9PERO|nr:hypothetical protein FQN60_017494 [Etheostoma spectabile]